jgi:predicted amidohydrolase
MKIALVSLNQVWEDKASNQKKCLSFIIKAAEYGAEIVVFPEMTLTGFSMNIELIAEQRDKSQTIDYFCQQAKKHEIAIAFGLVLKEKDKATNNLIIIDKKGIILSSYAKIHPFSFSGENKYYYGGNEICTCTLGKTNIGLTICYDLRFPEIFQILSQKCNLIITIANWPEKRVKHWYLLLQCRAIENQSFMLGVNRTGIDGNNHKYVKSSVIFHPLGQKIKPVHSFRYLDIYDLPLDSIMSIRDSFPVKQDRKNELYKSYL